MDESSVYARADWRGQLCGESRAIEDDEAITALRLAGADYERLVALDDALAERFRYREAIEACDEALRLRPDDQAMRRRRAGRYLSTLQLPSAKNDFLRCLQLGGDKVDVEYRLGLCCYFATDYDEAMSWFASCYPFCNDEMGIAVMYWHTLCCFRTKKPPHLLDLHRVGMDVDHHIAYEKAVRVFVGGDSVEHALSELDEVADDLDYVITLYGICQYLLNIGRNRAYAEYSAKLLPRDGFWPAFAWLAAWNDAQAESRLISG